MIYAAYQPNENINSHRVTHYALLILAVATSIDALAAGFTLVLLSVNGFLVCALIAVTTFIFSYVAVIMGAAWGDRIASKAEVFGGVILILVGLNFLLQAS